MVTIILCLEPHYQWLMTATPLVYGIEDMRWILCFRESSSRLTLQLLGDTIDYTLNLDGDWVGDGSTVSSTECGARFTPVSAPYKKGPEFSSIVHCTTIAWDADMLAIIGEVGKLRKATQSSHTLIRWHHSKETNENGAFAVLSSLMLRWTMVSHILFKNP